MLTNEQMKPNRFLRWHEARRRVAWIKARLAEGRVVILSTYTKHTRYDARHIDMFKANRNGAWVQRGRGWVCIDYVHLTAA